MATQPKYYGPGEAPKSPQYSVQDFAARIKAKYPAYADIDDQEIVGRFIKKWPQYQKALSTEALQERTAETLPSREETERAYAAAGPQIKPARKGLVPWLERAYGTVLEKAQRGTTRETAEFMAGPFLGPIKAATGLARIFTQPTPEPGFAGGARGLTEIIGGAMQAAPLPAMRATRGALPAFIPPFEAAMAGTRRAVEPLPISPELKELAATVIPLAGGAAIAGAPAIMRRGRAARAAPVEPAGPPRLGPAPPRRLLPPPRGPEIGIERELPGGEGVVRPVVERAPQAKPAPPTRAPAPEEPVYQHPLYGLSKKKPGEMVEAPGTRQIFEDGKPTNYVVGEDSIPRASLKKDRTHPDWVEPFKVPVPSTKPLPPPQPIAPREAAELGVAAERVPEVLRRWREGETAQKIAAERPVERPSMLEPDIAERITPEGARITTQLRPARVMFDLEAEVVKRGIVSENQIGRLRREAMNIAERQYPQEQVPKTQWQNIYIRALRERLARPEAAAKGERLATEIERPPSVLEAIRKAEEGRKPVFDEYGDEIVRGKTVVDSMGRTLQVDSVNAQRGELSVRYQGRKQIVPIAEVTVKRHGRPKGLEGIGQKPVRLFGESEEAFGARMRDSMKLEGERGFLRAEDVLPIEAIRDFVAGMKEIGKGITARFKGRAVRAPSKKPAQDLANQIDVVATNLTRDAEMLMEQYKNIKETGTFQPGPPGRGARAERAARAPLQPELKLSEQMIKDQNAAIVVMATEVAKLREASVTIGTPRINKALDAAVQQLNLLAERGKPMPRAAGRMVKAFDIAVPEAALAELQRVGLFLKKAVKPGLADYIFEAWVNFLLSGPLTHEVNFVSNALVRLSGFAERGGAATVDLLRAKVTGTPREVFYGEMAQEAFGFWRGIQEGVRNGLEAWRTEAPVTSKLEMARQKAIPGRAGRLIRTPGRALVAADEFAKGINRRVETNALAYRTAAMEGKTGVARAKRIAELVEKPTSKTKEAADVEALYRTFQQPFGRWSRHIASLRSAIPGARYIIPFLRVSINIAKFGLERTPLNFIRVGRMIAKGELKGAELSAEVAKPLIGTAIGAAVVILAAEGKITGGGPKDRGKRRVLYDTGWQPYSIKIRDTYYSYNRYEPLGALFGMSADLYEAFDERSELEQDEIVGRIALSISRNITSKTYLRGLSDAMNAVSDPDRYASAWVESIAGTAVPTIVAHWARARDPFYRDPTTVLEAVKARLPWISEQVQPRRGVFGQPARRQGGFVRRFSLPPIAGPVGGAPERELARLGMGVSAPSKRLGLRGRELELSPEEYGRLQETGGGFAKAMIARLVGRAAYQRMSDEEKERVVKTLFSRARGAARGKMIRSIPRPQLLQRYAEARR